MQTFFSLTIIGVWIAFLVGWVINLIEVIQLASAGGVVTTLFVLKAIGILVAPLGAFLGLFF